ncbi:MAG: hypothetical protein AAF639_05885 [Chloroflexota bacterium]
MPKTTSSDQFEPFEEEAWEELSPSQVSYVKRVPLDPTLSIGIDEEQPDPAPSTQQSTIEVTPFDDDIAAYADIQASVPEPVNMQQKVISPEPGLGLGLGLGTLTGPPQQFSSSPSPSSSSIEQSVSPPIISPATQPELIVIEPSPVEPKPIAITPVVEPTAMEPTAMEPTAITPVVEPTAIEPTAIEPTAIEPTAKPVVQTIVERIEETPQTAPPVIINLAINNTAPQNPVSPNPVSPNPVVTPEPEITSSVPIQPTVESHYRPATPPEPVQPHYVPPQNVPIRSEPKPIPPEYQQFAPPKDVPSVNPPVSEPSPSVPSGVTWQSVDPVSPTEQSLTEQSLTKQSSTEQSLTESIPPAQPASYQRPISRPNSQPKPEPVPLNASHLTAPKATPRPMPEPQAAAAESVPPSAARRQSTSSSRPSARPSSKPTPKPSSPPPRKPAPAPVKPPKPRKPRRRRSFFWPGFVLGFLLIGLASCGAMGLMLGLSPSELAELQNEGAQWVPPTATPIQTVALQPRNARAGDVNAAIGTAADAKYQFGQQLRNLTPSRVNIRQTPGHLGKPNGDIVAQVQPGGNIQILAGPESANELIWWRIEYTMGSGAVVQGWVAEATSSGVQILGQ